MSSKKFPSLSCLTIIGLIIFLLSGPAWSDDSFSYQANHTLEFNMADFQIEKINDYDLIRHTDNGFMAEIGRPMLPRVRIKVALPHDIKAVSLVAGEIKMTSIDGQFNIFPTQRPVEIGFDISNLEFAKPDKNIYNSSLSFPTEPIRMIRQSDLAGQSWVEIDIYPIQYSPSDQKLNLLTSISLTINGSEGYTYGDYLPLNISGDVEKLYKNRISRLVQNPQDISLQAARLPDKTSNLPDYSTTYDNVIITNGYVAGSYQPLADWHSRRGLHDTIITVDYIYANYAGGSDKEKIREFVIDAHQNWGTMYFLIGGEHTMVPFEYRQYEGDNIPSDAYYADYDDDWEYEVYVGRCTGETFEEIERFVNKVIEYETNPPDLNYVTDVAMLGMDLTLATQPPYYTLTRTGWLKDTIAQMCLPPQIQYTHIYDSDGGNHRDAFLAAINDGQNLINHSDHSNTNVMGCGDLNHHWYVSSNDAYYLTNYHKYFNMVSLGCYPNKMDYNDCIAEHFMFANDTTGAVSFTGNTRSGWFYVGNPYSLSSELDMYWWIGLFDYDQIHLGEALAFSKSFTDVESSWPYSDWTFNLLGDPAMTIWTNYPTTIDVSHFTDVSALPQTFLVHVEQFGGAPVENAYVCLWSENDVYATGYTDAGGDANIDISPTIHGELKVTVTKHNFTPYLGAAQVTGNLPPQCLIPNDTTIFQCETAEVALPVGCYDPDGNLADGPQLIRGPGEIIENQWYYTPTGNEIIEVTIVCTDSLGYSCESSFNVEFVLNNAPILTVPDDTAITQMAPASEIVLTLEMIDDNISDCYIVSGPGTLVDNQWSYLPADDMEEDVTICLADECGLLDEKTFHLSYEVFACGDANDNNELNILDITFLIDNLYNGGPTPDPFKCGDANSDEIVNILDITYLINHLYLFGPAPICP